MSAGPCPRVRASAGAGVGHVGGFSVSCRLALRRGELARRTAWGTQKRLHGSSERSRRSGGWTHPNIVRAMDAREVAAAKTFPVTEAAKVTFVSHGHHCLFGKPVVPDCP